MARNDPCVGPVQAHHAGERGLGQRAHDRTCIPLCLKHHQAWHDSGKPFAGWTKEERAAWAASHIERLSKLYAERAVGVDWW